MTMTVPASNLSQTGCRLVAADGRLAVLRSVELAVRAGGGLASVRLRQVFVNPFAEALSATYQLPLPADGAVVDFAFLLDGRRIDGIVQRREDARATFERAVLEGRTAALLDQERSAFFTQEIGNLPAGGTVVVELEVEQPLAWVAHGWQWRWPTVLGPRYLGASTADAERVTLDVIEGPSPVSCAVHLTIEDAATGPATSPSHVLLGAETSVALQGALDRDVVIRWPVATPAVGVRLELARPSHDPDAYGLLTVVPPAVSSPPVARDLCLLLDVSGSMGGVPLARLQAFSTALVGGLRDGDRLEMLAFSNSAHAWRTAPVRVDARARADATTWIGALRAGGGTAMHEAVTGALTPLRPDAQRQVVLVTDGYIGFEQEVVGRIRRALPAGARLHTVGIGSAVNRSLTSAAARAGGGHEAIVGPDESVQTAVDALLARTGDPLWIDVRVAGSAVLEVAPAATRDLMAGAPTRFLVRLRAAGGTVEVSARTREGALHRTLSVAPVLPGTGRRAIVTGFAREAVEDLEVALAGGSPAAEVDPAIASIGLRHRIATRLTSWVAVSDFTSVDPADPTRRVTVPQVLPYGVSAEGVGLRATAAPQAMLQRMAVAAPAGPPPAPSPSAGAVFSLEKSRRREPAKDAVVSGPVTAESLPTLRARSVRLRDGTLVVEVEVLAEVHWDPSQLTLSLPGGRSVQVQAAPGTTRAGAIGRGQILRIVVAWADAMPERIETLHFTI